MHYQVVRDNVAGVSRFLTAGSHRAMRITVAVLLGILALSCSGDAGQPLATFAPVASTPAPAATLTLRGTAAPNSRPTDQSRPPPGPTAPAVASPTALVPTMLPTVTPAPRNRVISDWRAEKLS